MFRAIAPFAVFAISCSAADNPVREVTSQATRAGNRLVPAFHKGYIYWIGLAGPANQVTIYAPDGHLAFSFQTQNGNAESVAVDTDAGMAVAWGTKEGGGIEFRDNSGTLRQTVRTGRYFPAHLSFAEDHSLWSLGWQRDASREGTPDRQGYMTVRKYLPNGKEAGAYLPRSLFPPGLEPGMESWQRSGSIVVAHDRVGLWVYSGDNGDLTEWVELDLNGNLLGRWRLDQFSGKARVALTTDGHVFVQDYDQRAKAHWLHKLNRDSSTWQPVEAAPSGRLEGADGDALVFSDLGLGPMHVRWYQHP